MRLTPAMCVEAGGSMGDVEDERGDEGLCIPTSSHPFVGSWVAKYDLDWMIIDVPGNDSRSQLQDPCRYFHPVRRWLMCRWALRHFRLLRP